MTGLLPAPGLAPEAVGVLLDALAAAGLNHMVTGGLVANAHGIARSTKDADNVVEMESGSFDRFTRSLPAALHLDPQISFETITGSQRQIVELIIELRRSIPPI